MGAVSITAVVSDAKTNARINGLTANNFIGLIAATNQTGQPVVALGNGEYVLSFDDSQTSLITCSVSGYQLNAQLWTNQASLTFAMQPTTQTPTGVFMSLLPDEQGNQPLPLPVAGYSTPYSVVVTGPVFPLKEAIIAWGDGSPTTSLTSTSLQNSPVTVSHEYANAGNYTATFTIVASNGGQYATNTVIEVPPPLSVKLSLASAGPFVAPVTVQVDFIITGFTYDGQNAFISWGDPTPPPPLPMAASGSMSHTYDTAGDYPITCTVDQGSTSTGPQQVTATVQIAVAGPPPSPPPPTTYVVVPDIVGMSSTQATAAATGAKLNLTLTKAGSPPSTWGKVTSQSPSAGTKRPMWSDVRGTLGVNPADQENR